MELPEIAGMTLDRAKAWLEEKLEQGTKCPCCYQYIKIYKRHFNSEMARVMIYIYKHSIKAPGWFHAKHVLGQTGKRDRDMGFLKHWRLVEEMEAEKEDGNPHAGYYRITKAGEEFVLGNLSIPKYKMILRNEVVSESKDLITIHGTRGKHFNYSELMSGVTPRPVQRSLFA